MSKNNFVQIWETSIIIFGASHKMLTLLIPFRPFDRFYKNKNKKSKLLQ